MLLHHRDLVLERLALLADEADDCTTLAATDAAPLSISYSGYSIFNIAASALQCPALSLPLMRLGGLPLGIQLLGQPHAVGALSGIVAYVAGLDVMEG